MLEYKWQYNSTVVDDEDDGLLLKEHVFLEEQSHRLPPVPEGKIVTPSMVNFAILLQRLIDYASFNSCTMSKNAPN